MSKPDPRALLQQSSVKITGAFSKTYTQISNKLAVSLDFKHNPMFLLISVYALYKYLESQFRDLDKDLESVVSDEIEYAYMLGFAMGLMAYYDSISTTYTLISILEEVSFMVNKADLVVLKKVAMKDLLQVTKNTEYMTKKLIQDVLTKHLTINHMKNMSRDDLAATIIKELTGKKLKEDIQKNMVAIIDKSGRRWTVDNYVDMVVRTKAQEVYVKGMQTFANKNGGNGDLAIIPRNLLTVDACKDFEGVIISMTGATEGYPTYEELKLTGLIFHPRCRHTPQPYWSEEHIPKDILSAHRDIYAEAEKLLRK